MPKVDWITWKTFPKEIINPQNIIDEIEDKTQAYTVYTTSVIYEGVKHELEKGGLNKENLSLSGLSPASEKATKIINNLEEIKGTIDLLTKKIQTSLEGQKQVEKSQLINAIENKIIEEEKIKNNTVSFNEKLPEENTVIAKESVQDIIDITNERIMQLKERLETAKSI